MELFAFPPRKDTRKGVGFIGGAPRPGWTGENGYRRVLGSSSIIILLVAVALAMAPIAHQSDDHMTNMTDQGPREGKLVSNHHLFIVD